jgi:hypothetical protein
LFVRTPATTHPIVVKRPGRYSSPRRAIDHGFINYPVLTQHDPFLADLRDDRRFIAMMEEAKPRWEKVIDWEERR